VNKQKQKEFFYLNKFKENFTDFPASIICLDERPDFSVKSANEIIGIEVTDFFREKASDTKFPLQQRLEVRNKIINLAKSIYDNKGLPSVYVNVHFDFNFNCRESAVQPMAKRLVELVEQSLPNLIVEKLWRTYDIQLKDVQLLSVGKRESEKSDWSAPFASFLPATNPQQIQEILDRKNTRCEDYRKKCNKIWLVIMMDRFQAPSFSLIPETVSEHLYAHNFDSAFLFLYDCDNLQKPPFLLQKHKK
jgi:hypothetical protein